jgi:hypothetical protein
MSGESGGGYRLPGVAVWLIAAGCAAYWLARAGVLATVWAVIAGVAAAAVVLAVAGAVKRRARRRKELLGHLAGAMRQLASSRGEAERAGTHVIRQAEMVWWGPDHRSCRPDIEGPTTVR